MTNKESTAGFAQTVLNLVKKHWFPLAVAIIAIAFIATNRAQTQINFLGFTVTTALWFALTVAAVLGLLVGYFLKR